MTLNLAESFKNIEEKPDSLVAYFSENIHIRLIGCGVFDAATSRTVNFLFPAFFAVYYQKGSVELQHNGTSVRLTPGSFYLFRPYDVYTGKRIGEAQLCFTYLQFDIIPFVERYNFGAIAMASSDTLFKSPNYQHFGKLMTELAADPPDKTGRTDMLKQLVKMILAQIIYDQKHDENSVLTPKKGRESEAINHAYQYTAEHLSDPIVISEILRDGKTSKASLERAFRNILGTTPQRALLRFKIERSMEMIQQGVPLKNIVKTLGFSSVFHFSNAFQNVMGMRPTEYRKEALKRS